jgi:hypothetical protein
MRKYPACFIIGITVLMSIGCGVSEEKDTKINPLVKYQGNTLLIRNSDSVTYDYIKVEINGVFKKELPLSIPPGEEAKYELSSFLKPDGERFNILRHGLVDISISCEVSKQEGGRWQKVGKAFYYGKFK